MTAVWLMLYDEMCKLCMNVSISMCNSVYRYAYPTMDQLADTVHAAVTFFGLKTVIGFGVGAGANILARFAVSSYKIYKI